MMAAAFCKWHNKRLEDVAEHEQEQCWEQKWDCMECPYLTAESEEEAM